MATVTGDTINFTQTDTSSTSGHIAACSGETLTGDTGNDRQMEDGGTAGSSTFSAGLGRLRKRATVFFETDAGEPGVDVWNKGAWVTRINVATGNNSIRWEGVFVCRLSSSGTNLGTVASSTVFSKVMSSGVKSYGCTALSDLAVNSSDRVYIVCIFRNSDTGTQFIDITPDQDISSPIAKSHTVTVGTYAVDTGVVAPSTKLYVPVGTFATTVSSVSPSVRQAVSVSPFSVSTASVAPSNVIQRQNISPQTVSLLTTARQLIISGGTKGDYRAQVDPPGAASAGVVSPGTVAAQVAAPGLATTSTNPPGMAAAQVGAPGSEASEVGDG